MAQRSSGSVKGTVEMDLQHAIPFLIAQFDEVIGWFQLVEPPLHSFHLVGDGALDSLRMAWGSDTGIVDEYIETSVVRHHSIDSCVEGLGVRDIEHAGFAADLGGYHTGCCFIDVVDDDVGSIGSQPSAKGATHTRAGAGDEDYVTVQEARVHEPTLRHEYSGLVRILELAPVMVERVGRAR